MDVVQMMELSHQEFYCEMAEAHLAPAAAGARTWTADVGAPALRSAIALAGEWASATRTAVAPHVRAAWSSSLRSVFAARAAADPSTTN